MRRANSTRSSTVPSLGSPDTAVGERSSPRSSNTPMMRMSESRCAIERIDQRRALLVGADDDGAPVETALLGPAPHQQEQRAAEGDQHDQADDIERAEPDARELVAGLGEERDADDDEEHHRPRRGEPEILLLVAAEGLHLVDVGGLERQRRQRRDRDDGGEVVPREAVERNHIGEHRRRGRPASPARIRSGGRCRRARSANRRRRSAARRSSARPATARAASRRPASAARPRRRASFWCRTAA